MTNKNLIWLIWAARIILSSLFRHEQESASHIRSEYDSHWSWSLLYGEVSQVQEHVSLLNRWGSIQCADVTVRHRHPHSSCSSITISLTFSLILSPIYYIKNNEVHLQWLKNDKHHIHYDNKHFLRSIMVVYSHYSS